MKDGHLIASYIFGSVGRSDHDDLSDLDVLAIVRNGTGKVDNAVVISMIPNDLRKMKVSISWYGGDRLREMFRNGELFAWHLYKEAIPLSDPNNFIKNLGPPSDYRDARVDIASFQKVMRGIPAQLSNNRNNAIYEAGLIYVCLRNIAMAASSDLCNAPDFSRYSPFRLPQVRPCPISIEEYEALMNCRMAGQRGIRPPENVNEATVINIFERLSPWVEELHSSLIRKAEWMEM
jgi:hypothetical protein